ncbi:MAG: hypothetical protein KDA66_20905, partial [Planctomycetaceae bacterium]|nr:hypothetical protein [Planctomycetaceae bacterium]
MGLFRWLQSFFYSPGPPTGDLLFQDGNGRKLLGETELEAWECKDLLNLPWFKRAVAEVTTHVGLNYPTIAIKRVAVYQRLWSHDADGTTKSRRG